jgi:hypothetical protein
MLEGRFSLKSGRYAAEREQAELALRAVAPDLTEERIRRLTLAQRPASALATLKWLLLRIASGESLDGLSEASEQPRYSDLAADLAPMTGYSLDEIQDLVDYVWFHPHALKHLSQAERVNLIRRSVRASVHNPIAVAQVALEGA